MTLTPEQETALRTWLADGATLSEVQNRLRTEFGLHPTFLDVRMTVMELGAQVRDRVAQVAADDVTKAKLPPKSPEAAAEAGALPAAGGVTLTVDTLQVIPGALVSGSVVFSDGEKARWYIDQLGRFGLETELPGYTPGDADMRDFQVKLRQELSTRGF